MRDGVRRVTEVAYVAGLEEDTILLGKLFTFKYLGENPDGTLHGVFEQHPSQPRFLKRLEYYGLADAFLETLNAKKLERA